MWQEDRHQRIRALLSTLKRVSTERIMADLGVSRETVRRDLLDLEALGELRRVHGGAIKPADEAPISERAQTHVKSKKAIAKAATGVVASGQTLFIDAGTTTAALADELAKLANLTIITNSIDVAMKMRGAPDKRDDSTANEVILLGGSISDRALSTTGETTILVILADYSKIGQRSRIAYCLPEKIDLLITNRKATEVAAFAQLKRKVGKVILA
jgi:DeoR/GlpR family transcriptional regulator of sugar metabolism